MAARFDPRNKVAQDKKGTYPFFAGKVEKDKTDQGITDYGVHKSEIFSALEKAFIDKARDTGQLTLADIRDIDALVTAKK